MLESLAELPIDIDPPTIAAAAPVVELARRHGLSAYDAAYLELAVRRKLPLATLDHRLRDAAARARVEVLPH